MILNPDHCGQPDCPCPDRWTPCGICGSDRRLDCGGWLVMTHRLSPHLNAGRGASAWQTWPDNELLDYSAALDAQRERNAGGPRAERVRRMV